MSYNQLTFWSRSAVGEPFCEWVIVDLAKDVRVNNCTSWAVDDAGSWVACARNECCQNGCLLWFQWWSNSGHVFHWLVEAVRVLITRDYKYLEVLCATSIPRVVVCFQVFLEGLAASSPACGVEDHDELVAVNATSIMLVAWGVDVFTWEPVCHCFF